MVKAYSIRLDPELIAFIDYMDADFNRSDKIRSILLWLKEYQTYYLQSVQDYIKVRMTKEPQAS